MSMPTFVVIVTLSGFYQSSRRIRPSVEAAAKQQVKPPVIEEIHRNANGVNSGLSEKSNTLKTAG